jgi:thiol-disulfide isomerase/thioredoxin
MAFNKMMVRAPEITGLGGWINADGKQLSLADLRGRVVVLDFWTSCCINCIHVIEELRVLEDMYGPDQLVVVGVHSPKFEHEGNHETVVAAVERHGIEHPVLDDPGMSTWAAYGIRAWPTLVVIDQEGYVAYIAAGERQLPALVKVIGGLLEKSGQGATGASPAEKHRETDAAGQIWYPSKIARMSDGRLLLTNTGNHNLLVLAPDGAQVLRAIGSGVRGSADGPLSQAEFSEPTAALILDSELASKVPYDIVVADRGNHALRTISLADDKVDTLAGGLASPWDVVYWPAVDRLVIAMAGRHFIASIDIRSGAASVLAGSGREGIRDGRASQAEFAQPSGLAAESGPDGSLWVIDAETSALRRLWQERGEIFVETAIGQGLFDFGHRDGPASQALMQHPQGLSLDGQGNVIIADTYNGAVRRYDPSTRQVSTVIAGLKEPTDVLSLESGLLVVESAANKITPVGLDVSTDSIQRESAAPVKGTPTEVSPNLTLKITFDLPGSMHVDEGTDNPVRVTITSTPEALLPAGAGLGYELERQLKLEESVGSGTLHVTAVVASCDDTDGVCTLMTQDWNLHVIVTGDGAQHFGLVLSGPPAAGAGSYAE